MSKFVLGIHLWHYITLKNLCVKIETFAARETVEILGHNLIMFIDLLGL